MRRTILQSSAFLRAARRVAKRQPEAAASIHSTITALANDAFQPVLKTHKLKGNLEDSWACSAGYDLRIVFEFVQHNGAEAILLQSIGTHDQVY